jgi:hypothetical protein
MASPSGRFRLVIADAGGGVNRGHQTMSTVGKKVFVFDFNILAVDVQGLLIFPKPVFSGGCGPIQATAQAGDLVGWQSGQGVNVHVGNRVGAGPDLRRICGPS